MVDLNWDETNPVEASYKASKLQRWNLALLKSTWSAVSQSQAAKDNLTMSSSGSEVLQISGKALDDKGVSKPLKEFQNVCNSLNSCKNAWGRSLPRPRTWPVVWKSKVTQASMPKAKVFRLGVKSS